MHSGKACPSRRGRARAREGRTPVRAPPPSPVPACPRLREGRWRVRVSAPFRRRLAVWGPGKRLPCRPAHVFAGTPPG
ncbi:MAG: hypothetical protein AMS16_07405 [Planctomycetes bacterium DG_58]|nr:MAG: hypothetical protein AMS16_07405 [Planctomycetes bacterium DG_58]